MDVTVSRRCQHVECGSSVRRRGKTIDPVSSAVDSGHRPSVPSVDLTMGMSGMMTQRLPTSHSTRCRYRGCCQEGNVSPNGKSPTT